MAGKKKDPKVAELQATVAQLTKELELCTGVAKDSVDAAERAEKRYNDLRKETREETRPLYVIAECLRGGKRVGITRQAYSESSHELLGLLEIAVEDVKLQIRGHMSQPHRVVVQNPNTMALQDN